MAVSETVYSEKNEHNVYEYNVLSETVPVSMLYFHIQVGEETFLKQDVLTSSAN